MIGSTNFSLAWLVNLLPTSGLSFFNRDLSTATAKTTMVALGIILANGVPLASAIYGCERSCMHDCSMAREDCFIICKQDCFWKPT